MGVVYGGRGKLCVDSGERGSAASRRGWLSSSVGFAALWHSLALLDGAAMALLRSTHAPRTAPKKRGLSHHEICLPSTLPTTEIRGFGPGQSILFRGRLDRRGPRSRLSPQKERTRGRARCGSKFTLGHIFPMAPQSLRTGTAPARASRGRTSLGRGSDEAGRPELASAFLTGPHHPHPKVDGDGFAGGRKGREGRRLSPEPRKPASRACRPA